MLRGIGTINFYADDLEVASEWYASLLGVRPYFERPGYVEFRIGDSETELGIIDRKYAPAGSPTEPGGAVVYWHVDDLGDTVDRLVASGATDQSGPTERGAEFVTASVVDPFGNVLGVMSNPHYAEIFSSSRT